MAEEKIEDKKLNEQMQKPILSWDSAEYVHYSKSNNWYVLVSLAGIVIAAGLYYFGQLSGSIVVVAATAVFAIMSVVKPKEIHCEIFQQGVIIESKPYKYEQFKSFWLTTGEIPKIKFKLLGRLSGEITMPLEKIDIDKVRELLVKHLPEEEPRGEDVGDFFNRFLRF